MIINTNSGSASAARILAENTSSLQKSLKRLSMGSKISRIDEDAAGSSVANKMSAELKRNTASIDNLSNLISYSQTQDGYLEKVSSTLERMSEIAMLSTDETKTDADLAIYNKEFAELQSFIASMSSKQFNGVDLFNGSGQLNATVGTSITGASVVLTMAAADLTAADYALVAASTTAVTSFAEAANALVDIQSAISALATDRAEIGSNLSRLEAERSALAILRDNLSAARSRIVDVDVAEESANFAKQQILVQSGTAMLAQANILPQSALRLIS
jgi:flagellin